MALAFGSGLANPARDGASSKIGGRSQSIIGGEPQEFPYLITLNGAKFPPGDYQGVVSIRQGGSVIARVVSFRVIGKPPSPHVGTAEGPTRTAMAPRGEGDDAEVALPEIEPAQIDSTGLKMRKEEQKRFWEDAAEHAMGYLARLPNFRCIQETRRLTAPIKAPDQLKETDSFKDDLVYEDGRERYRTIEVNNVKVDKAPIAGRGVRSRNEFGSLLRGLFNPDVAASYQFAGRAIAMNVLCRVFEVAVSRPRSNLVLDYGGRREQAGYTGRVFIDEETGLVRRLTIWVAGLPQDFGLQSPALSLDYDTVKIGKDDYLLPVRSLLQLRHGKVLVRNETIFRNYRKFDAESEIVFQNN